MEFRIDGGVSLGKDSAMSGMVKRILEAIESLPDGEFLTTRGLADRLSVSRHSMLQHTGHPALNPYKVQKPNSRYNLYGNAATVTTFKDEFYGEK